MVQGDIFNAHAGINSEPLSARNNSHHPQCIHNSNTPGGPCILVWFTAKLLSVPLGNWLARTIFWEHKSATSLVAWRGGSATEERAV